MDGRIVRLIATVLDRCGKPRTPGRGHPPTETVRVLAALRRFLREGTPWRSMRATETEASGSTLRRRLASWAETGLLARMHALLVGMLRGHPDLILDSCSVRAKRGGDLIGPNPTARGKRGTKYHVAVDGEDVPVACAPRPRPTSTTRSSSSGCSCPPSPWWRASAPCSPTRATTPSATGICAAHSVRSPASTSAAARADRVGGSGAGPSNAVSLSCWTTGAWRSAMTGSASLSSRCSRQLAYSWLRVGSPANSENRL